MKELPREQWHWNAMADEDPMYFILTEPAKKGRWDEDEFFARGRKEISDSLSLLEREVGPLPRRRVALDFGCGLGRLTQALANHFETVHGVDISERMVEQARAKNRMGTRVVYHANPTDKLHMIADGSVDFVYSRLVLQHIPVAEMRGYIEEFGRVLAPGGVAMFQLLTRATSVSVRVRHKVRAAMPNLYRTLRDALSRRARFELNTLSPESAEKVLARRGVSVVRVLHEEASDREYDSRWIVGVKGGVQAP